MNQDFQLKLQAYLDGELTEREAREVEAALPGDVEARALVAELRNTGAALGVFESELKLPETREFFWSKIQRQIQREERPEPVRPATLPFWQRLVMPAGAFAALIIVGLVVLKQFSPAGGPPSVAVELPSDSGAMTYRDEVEKMTVVWLSYPAENQFAEYE